MSTILMYFERVLSGMTAYLQEDKIVVILVAVLLLFWLKEKKAVDNKGNRLLLYAAIMTVVLLCPLTAVAVLVYQTVFYDYAWAWSMVPIFPVLAYAGVVLYEEWKPALTKTRTIFATMLLVVLLFVCGNQGVLQTVGAQDVEERYRAEGIVRVIGDKSAGGESILWGPKRIMQEVRRQTGEIKLVYGRDMWDEKSGAYDYGAYSTDYIEAYEWMELVALLSGEATGEESFHRLCGEYELMEDAQSHMENMLASGVNVIVIPEIAAGNFGEILAPMVTKEKRTMEEIYTQQYVIYLLQ